MQAILDFLTGPLNDVAWLYIFLPCVAVGGIFLTIRTGGMQFTRFGYAMRNTVGKMFKKKEAGKGAVTPLQAVTTALAATVGTGNIVGTSQAIALGGYGAVFWLWIAALLGMIVKYSEVTLSIKYRERDAKGDWVGGPMYYIVNGLGKNWKWLAVIFSVFGAFAAFGIGNAVQVGNIVSSINNAVDTFGGNTAANTLNIFGQDVALSSLIIGVIIAVIVGLVLIGGIKRLGQVTEKLVPIMSVIYILGCLVVIGGNIGNIGKVFSDIFVGAFNPSAVVGGVAGFTIMQCITMGVKRGVFSNEAGLGSAPMAHAATSETNPVKQGLYGIFEVFMDTIVICTLSGVTLLISGIAIPYGDAGAATTTLNSQAFGTVFGGEVGGLVIAVGITLFALSTILSWGLYGSRCCEFIFGTKSIKIYQILFVLIVLVGATMKLDLAWNIADTLNGLMALPNLVALLGLSGVVVKLSKDYFAQVKLDKQAEKLSKSAK